MKTRVRILSSARLILCVTILATLSLAASAWASGPDEPALLWGYVRDANTHHVVCNTLARVTVEPGHFRAWTDALGRYRIRLPAGAYDVTAMAKRYLPQSQPAQVQGVTRLDVLLDAPAVRDQYAPEVALRHCIPFPVGALKNRGTADLQVHALAWSPPLPGELEWYFGDYLEPPFTLAPGESVPLWLHWSGGEHDPLLTTASIATSAPCEPLVTWTLSLTFEP